MSYLVYVNDDVVFRTINFEVAIKEFGSQVSTHTSDDIIDLVKESPIMMLRGEHNPELNYTSEDYYYDEEEYE